MFQVESQYLDESSGFHVIRLKNGSGATHVLQIAVGHRSCPACGHVKPREHLDELDPKQLTSNAIAALNASECSLRQYAEKHGLQVAPRARS